MSEDLGTSRLLLVDLRRDILPRPEGNLFTTSLETIIEVVHHRRVGDPLPRLLSESTSSRDFLNPRRLLLVEYGLSHVTVSFHLTKLTEVSG